MLQKAKASRYPIWIMSIGRITTGCLKEFIKLSPLQSGRGALIKEKQLFNSLIPAFSSERRRFFLNFLVLGKELNGYKKGVLNLLAVHSFSTV
jgi:hypothetical protein